MTIESQEDLWVACAASEEKAWDSEILGLSTHHLTHLFSSSIPIPHTALRTQCLQELSAASLQRGIERITARVSSLDVSSREALSRADFAPLSQLMKLETSLLQPVKMPIQIQEATSSHEKAVARIAGVSFRHDRFHEDPSLPQGKADSLHRTWAVNCLRGRADVVLVHRERDQVQGFCALILDSGEKICRIDLLAVDPERTRRGVGSRLIQGALSWCTGKVSRIVTATQASNIPALRLYTQSGFFPTASFFDFRWTPERKKTDP